MSRAGRPRKWPKSLGMSIGTVYQYKSRVVARIRREIEQFDGESKTICLTEESRQWSHDRSIAMNHDCRSFLDDDLPDLEQAELNDHLETCASCRRTLERLAAGSRLWAELRELAGRLPGAATDAIDGQAAA